MIWVSWRQQRTETLIAAAIIAALAAVLVPTGIAMANSFDRDGLSACLGQSASQGCGSAIESFLMRYQWLDNLTSWFTLVPGLIGVLLGIAVSRLIAANAGWPIVVSPDSVMLAFAVAGFVGIFFGFYPARKASRLDPIDALRYE